VPKYRGTDRDDATSATATSSTNPDLGAIDGVDDLVEPPPKPNPETTFVHKPHGEASNTRRLLAAAFAVLFVLAPSRRPKLRKFGLMMFSLLTSYEVCDAYDCVPSLIGRVVKHIKEQVSGRPRHLIDIEGWVSQESLRLGIDKELLAAMTLKASFTRRNATMVREMKFQASQWIRQERPHWTSLQTLDQVGRVLSAIGPTNPLEDHLLSNWNVLYTLGHFNWTIRWAAGLFPFSGGLSE
jgi:hypothetical protein